MVLADWPCPRRDGGETREFALAFDSASHIANGPRLLIIPALLDEGHRLRRFTVELMRRLAAAGIASVLPDLPGTGDSLSPLEAQNLASWRTAAAAAATHFAASHVLTIRAAATLAPAGLPGWHYAPHTPASQLRQLLRARILARREAGLEENTEALLAEGGKLGLELAGYRLGPAMIDALLAEAGPGHLPAILQTTLGGRGLWLRAEPGEDPAQADTMACFIAAALKACPGNPVPRHRQGPLLSRQPLLLPCEGNQLAATVDLPAPTGRATSTTSGLVIVTGGTELRCGAWGGQAQLAARLAAAGHPVLRFDRRGVGDSEGRDPGYTTSAPDIAAAIAGLRAASPGLGRVVVWGNCDGASALMLAEGAGADALALSNPWTFEDTSGSRPNTAPPQALRAHYLQRLANPAAILRLLTGKVSPRALIASLLAALRPAPPPTSLAQDIAAGIARFPGPVTILLASRDRTAQAFLASWNKADPRLRHCREASHSFVESTAREWLFHEILAVLQG
jgi:exosortase A-associated hydrolase 1